MDSAHGLAQAAGKLGVTEEILQLAAHAKVLSVLTGEGAVQYGHGRVVVRDGSWRDLVEAARAGNGTCPAMDERTAGYHAKALSLLIADPDADHDAETLLSAEELHLQVHGMAGPHRELPDRRMHRLFEERAQRHPDAVAAQCRDTQWTYRELNERANRIAHFVLGQGVQAEDVVAVISERNLDWMAAVLGVFKAGACYLPIEPNFPAERIEAMLTRSNAAVQLTEQVLTGIVDGPTTDPNIPVHQNQLAYIYFTSGSTGQPKGAMCEHGGMINHLYAKIDDLGIGEGAVVAQTAPQCFDISLWQLVSALLVGGRTVIVPQQDILDINGFLDTVETGEVEVLQLVPSFLEVVLSELEVRPRDLPALRCVSVTGEAIKKELVQRWFAHRPHGTLVNAYGLTETSDDTNHEVMTSTPDTESVPLGKVIANTTVYVLDERLRPMPLGAVGEIAFSGICVGRGYINDPERTAAAFMDDPLRPGRRMYRSGDFGRWLPDGRLEFLGRRDAQVKIRGFRIEIGEVENRLLGAPGVKDAAVVVADGPQLVAFFSATGDLTGEQLLAHAAVALADYMVPTAAHRLDKLPLTDNGKIDKKALKAAANDLSEQDYVAPATDAERKLAATWADVLGLPVERIGADADFFELGGTSLSAVRLAIKLKPAVSLTDITAAPTLSKLAALVEQAG
ncbi:amino acid adenylation domain-containing protein [Kutzneria sp. 744]|uniref:non-ribosomal peptide synthetase n=1 Tax=Kutzneria sp. (strain 744) TaxID=345341 RepID=UPI0003EEBC26|nr:non-ribosomal peptide synthetase [Kutzneria sp. 744]EWM10633.1 non-ribosomal peptide synthetase [Kutzneria sp. 744]